MVDYREKLAEIMDATVEDEAAHHDWWYDAVRPMWVPPTWHPGMFVKGDCSKGVQYLNRWVGAPDPMEQAFNPYGNSSTLWLHCQHLDHPWELLVGDFVTFGNGGDEHAAMVRDTGRNPKLWGFGHQGAPSYSSLSFDTRPQQYLRNPLPTYVPTPADRLRARTGWFAWMAWYEGEGDWRHYHPQTPAVRPSVPQHISADWWLRRAKFLLNRKKGNKARG